ncbi:hypothetical protein VFPPC_15219 [Pochonia chlamydosporia 170]|uniref:Uncharacterized protein n=1 Tax=Pochonia chlamydosporia 170 TaxID=1380566 RepID=A0A179G6W4_METCM|nr:hypothetical protein VFPPC_15219 [Pochonia chlamydosporia 170]OAQ72919.1 hypothetical protein VFPPC_15219 [Pochonia chlamydosporia 170]
MIEYKCQNVVESVWSGCQRCALVREVRYRLTRPGPGRQFGVACRTQRNTKTGVITGSNRIKSNGLTIEPRQVSKVPECLAVSRRLLSTTRRQPPSYHAPRGTNKETDPGVDWCLVTQRRGRGVSHASAKGLCLVAVVMQLLQCWE